MAKTPDTSSEIDMTPMIDCVFLLLIFLMVVSEIAKADLDDLTLAEASHAEPDRKEGRDKTIIVNIRYVSKTESAIRNRGQTLKPDELEKMFNIESEATREKDPESGLMLSTINLMIRPDENCQWGSVQTVFEKAQKNGIWKTIIGASPKRD